MSLLVEVLGFKAPAAQTHQVMRGSPLGVQGLSATENGGFHFAFSALFVRLYAAFKKHQSNILL